jgi:hypothetical protein
MATSRQSYFPQIDRGIDPKISVHLQRIYPAINDHDQAITSLNNKVNSLATQLKFSVSGSEVSAPPSSPATTPVTASQAKTIATQQANLAIQATLGSVNQQTGTSYTTQSGDYGGLVSTNNSVPTTVTLNDRVQAQWFTTLANVGSGTTTLVPLSGTINGASSFTLQPSQGVQVYFDGQNFHTSSVPPSTAFTGTITLASLTPLGSQGSLTITNGLIVAAVNPT